MKKVYLLLPLVLGAALALFLVFRNTGKTSETSPEELSASQGTGSHVTAAQWADSKGSTSGAGEGAGTPAGEQGRSAAEASGPKAELTQKLVEVSGIGKKFVSMAPMLKEQLEMMISDQLLSEKERDELMAKFRNTISGEKLLADYNAKLAENFTPEELNELVEMYEDPQVKRFNQLNNDLSDPEKIRDVQEDIVEFMKDADLASIPPEKLKQFDVVDSRFNVSKQAIDLTNSLFNLSGESDPEASKQIEAAIGKEIKKGFMYTLKDFSDSDLAAFVKKVDNDKFQKANELVHGVIKDPLMQWMKAMQKDMKKGSDKAEATTEKSAAVSVPH